MIIPEHKIIDQFPTRKLQKNLDAILKTASLNHRVVIIAIKRSSWA